MTGADVLDRADLAAIAEAMRAAGETADGELSSALIAGGRSNLTYRLTDGTGRWVMRTPPRAGRTPSAHDVVRELRITAALQGTPVPVARPVLVWEDERLIGVPFAVCAFVDGITVQTRSALHQLPPHVVDSVVERLVGTLADLHRVDHIAVGLGELARPGGYAARQLRRWSGQWKIVAPAELRAAGEQLGALLAERVPGQRRTAVVHGDFRVDNTILDISDTEDPRIAAVVDWELATVGDPDADVAMMCAYRHPVFDLIIGARARGPAHDCPMSKASRRHMSPPLASAWPTGSSTLPWPTSKSESSRPELTTGSGREPLPALGLRPPGRPLRPTFVLDSRLLGAADEGHPSRCRTSRAAIDRDARQL